LFVASYATIPTYYR